MKPLAALLALAAPAAADDIPEIFLPLIQEAAIACEDFEKGEFAFDAEKGLSRSEIDHGISALFLDELGFQCSTAPSYWTGTGGRNIHIAVNGTIALTTMARAFEVVDFGPTRVLLLNLHGSACGGYGALGCVEALVWSDGAFRSVNTN